MNVGAVDLFYSINKMFLIIHSRFALKCDNAKRIFQFFK